MLKRVLPFIFAGGLGLVAVVMAQQYLSEQRQLLEEERARLEANYESGVEVIFARKNIPEGTALTVDHLGLRAVPKAFVQPTSTSRATELIGRVTKVPFAEGEQILKNKLRLAHEVAPAMAGTLSALTPQGKRAVTLGMDELTGVGGFVQPGDTVDVIWTFQAPRPGGDDQELVTTTLFQDVMVLAVGGQLMGQLEGEGPPRSADYTVTVGLNPQEAAVLMFARERGRVELSLRSRQEGRQQFALPPADIDSVMEAIYGDAMSSRPVTIDEGPPTTRRVVEVFRGLERSVVTVEE